MSDISKQEAPPQKHVDKPVIEGASVRKKTVWSRFKDDFIKVDYKNLKEHVHNSAVGFIKQAVSEIVRNGIDMILYGQDGAPNRNVGWGWGWNWDWDNRPSATRVNFINYGGMYTDKKKQTPAVRDYGSAVYDFGEVVVPSLTHAQKVIAAMDEIVSSYGSASVADLYEASGITPNSTDWRWGWSDFGPARAEQVGNGQYVIKTPPAELLRTN